MMSIKFMKFLVLGLVMLGLCNTAAAGSPQENQVIISAVDTVNSKKCKVADNVKFKIAEATIPANREIAVGTEVIGKVIAVKRASGWGCPGKLTIEFQGIRESVKNSSLTVLPLEIRGHKPNFFVQFSLLGGFVKGNQAEIKAGDKFLLKIKE